LTTIDGFIVFPAGMALSAITGIVRLENVSYADALSLTLAAAPFSSERGGQPIPFRLVLAGSLDVSQDYMLTAEATVEDIGRKRKFGTRSAIPWSPGGPSTGLTVHLEPWT
jgi:hypothetical protein